MSDKSLSIITVNYKSGHFISKCLASVSKIPFSDKEIVVVNNDESDLDHLKDEFENIRIVDHRKNIGFGAAANLGAEEARGKWLLFLNPDSEIVSENVREVLGLFGKYEEVAVIGSRVISEGGSVQEWIAGQETGLHDLILNNLRLSRSKKIWESEDATLADWVSGTAMFVRKDFFHEVGGFDDGFFMYFEDMDLCKRFRSAGKKIIYHPGFLVRHSGGRSYRDKQVQKKQYYLSQRHYFKKHRPAWEGVAVEILRRIFF